MNKITFAVSLSSFLLINGCASLGKENRIGKNDGSDPCFFSLEKLDETAIFYKDQRLTDIAAGVLIGGGTGALAGAAVRGNTTAMIIGGITGAIAGGFAADAYWKNKLLKASNQLDQATAQVEIDLNQDISRLSNLDKDISALVRCRTTQRDQIKKQFLERKLSFQQAQIEWKKWGDLVRKDQEEIKYLNEALDNIRKIEESYTFAISAIEAPSNITDDMQRKWREEIKIDQDRELQAINQLYRTKLSEKKLKGKEKKILKKEQKQKISDIKKTYANKELNVNNKISPKGNALKLMISSIHEKHESIRKNQAQIASLLSEAGNDKGFEQINSKLNVIYGISA